MIRAANGSHKFAVCFAANARSTVSADVKETAHRIVIADNNDALSCHFAQKKVAVISDLLAAAGANPHPIKQGVELPAKYLGIGVVASRKR
jgi:hypothetical protein